MAEYKIVSSKKVPISFSPFAVFVQLFVSECEANCLIFI